MLTPQHCRDLCKRRGTRQCAPICLSHSTLLATCPEAQRVWGDCSHANARKVRQYNGYMQWTCPGCGLNYMTEVTK
jgi:hypothetical protein